jgi:cytochrome c biogenesis protein CcmG, thiol:disulfide interchange protein DsbE
MPHHFANTRRAPGAGGLLSSVVSFLCTAITALAVFAYSASGVSAADLAAWSGGAAPRLVLKDMTGKEHDLAQYRGKVVLVNFWATWCEPCRAEMPSMEALRQRYADAPFAVLAVNVDEPEQRIRAFLQRMPLTFQILLDPGMQATREWNARILPASFLVGRDGRIRYSARGDVNWTGEAVTRVVADLLKTP